MVSGQRRLYPRLCSLFPLCGRRRRSHREGRMYAGCNVENVSYPNGTCAETGAIAAMVAGGDRKIVEIVIVADGQNLITPCGACRQRLKEFAVPGMLVHLADVNGIRQTITLEELLPCSFTDESLRHD